RRGGRPGDRNIRARRGRRRRTRPGTAVSAGRIDRRGARARGRRVARRVLQKLILTVRGLSPRLERSRLLGRLECELLPCRLKRSELAVLSLDKITQERGRRCNTR